MEELETLLLAINNEMEQYKVKPTKTSSKRIRVLLGQLKNRTPIIRARLVDLDKVA